MAQQFIIQGRIVWGHPSKGRPKKDVRTKQPIIKDGQPVTQYAFGVAIDKNTFAAQVWPQLQAEARAAFPNGAPPNFTYKFKDGDTVDAKGQPYSAREGYAGHCVMTIATEGFAPTVYKQEGGSYRQLSPEEIKCGDFVAVSLTIKYNGAVSPNTPGLYLNPQGVVLIGYGQEIVSSGADPDELFQGFKPQHFAGMSATPVMSSAPLPTAMNVAPTAPAMPAYAAPAAPVAPLPAPAHDFVNAAMGQAPAPQQYGAMPMGAAPAAPAMPAGYPGMPVPR